VDLVVLEYAVVLYVRVVRVVRANTVEW
jgi:hypothetical protein